MITLKMTGGLGNQMFVYAFGRKLESLGYEVRFDISAYKNTTKGGGGRRIFAILRSSILHSSKVYLLEDIAKKFQTSSILFFSV